MEIVVVRWDEKVLTPYVPPEVTGVRYYLRSKLNDAALRELLGESKPDLVFVSGWMDGGYLRICKLAKKRKITVITSADSHWIGTWKQVIGAIYARLFFSKYFDYIMVPGAMQFEFAKKIGFRTSQIIF
ncbi:MAG: hypothetical protein K2U26_20540, partial [Cyclobacteriaceae bacterium]|nr:hypothetical protein [Cyclobacteriaceae bacterium]